MSGGGDGKGGRMAARSHNMFGLYRRMITLAVALVMLLGGALLLSAEQSRAVTGPAGYYAESNGDIIEICSDAACTAHTTSFSPGSTIYLRVTTDRITNNNRDSLYLLDYLGNRVASTAGWNKQTWSPPYIYTAQITVPGSTSTYLQVEASIRRGGNRIDFEQVLEIAGVNQSLTTYADAGYAEESDTFRSGDVMYVRGYGSGAGYSSSQTGSNNQLYDLTNSLITSWGAPAVFENGNWYSFPLTLPASGLTSGDWYQVMTDLRTNNGGTIMRMTRLVLIDDEAPTAAITSPAPDAFVTGTLSIDGVASDAHSFNSYVLEYGAGASPATWTPIGTVSYNPVAGGPLGSWDTTTVADGLYTLRLIVLDRALNTSVATIPVNVDSSSPPVITAVAASGVSGDGATITWDTDEPADSQVEYGASSGVYTDASALDPALVTGHNQTIAGLPPSTTYYYRVRSADAAGHVSYSSEYSFKTANITVLQLSPGLGLDTSIRGNQPDWNLGGDTTLDAGDIGGADWGTLRSILKFDLSGIPATATVNSATLSLYQWYQEDASPLTIDVHYLTGNWTEGTGAGSATGDGATWLTTNGADDWTDPGGDYDSTVSASSDAPGAVNTWVDWDLTALTQSWADGSITNNGLLLKQDAEYPAGSDAKSFYSSEFATDAALRPKLTIEWTGDDVTGPVIAGVSAGNIHTGTAGISWSTSEAADSRVEYGTTTSYGATTPVDAALVNQHALNLAGLTGDTLYHYRVHSVDAAGNETVSGDFTFHTAVQLVIQPDAAAGVDTWIDDNNPDENNGINRDLLIGDYRGGSATQRALLDFDVSAIPAGSTITAATLSIYQRRQSNSSTPELGVYPAVSAWTEGSGNGNATGDGASWDTRDGVTPWTTGGGDFDAVVATAVAPGVRRVWVDFDIAALTQEWVDGARVNDGFFIRKTAEGSASDYKTYCSSDYTRNPSLRPKLVVEYVPPAGSITLTVDETFNRDGSGGSGSVGFGSLDAGATYYVGDTAMPQYAVKLGVQSDTAWGLRVSAADDLVHTLNPANIIGIGYLNWKTDGGGVYAPFIKSPSEETILSGQAPTAGISLMYDYQFIVPADAVSGNYSTSIAYTVYTE